MHNAFYTTPSYQLSSCIKMSIHDLAKCLLITLGRCYTIVVGNEVIGKGCNRMPTGCEKSFEWLSQSDDVLNTKYPYGEFSHYNMSQLTRLFQSYMEFKLLYLML